MFRKFEDIFQKLSLGAPDFSRNLVECIDFNGLIGATVVWSRYSE